MRKIFRLARVAAFLGALLAFAPAHAGDLSVTVRGRDGAPLADAVVTFHPAAGVPAGPIRFDWPYRVTQQNIDFSPKLLIVPVGATVGFPNLDRVRHHVYSFSQGNRFELRLFGQDETRTHTFTNAGVAAIGCNIHDRMVAYIVIVDTPFAAATNAQGTVTLRGVSGAGELRVWRQDVRAPGMRVSRRITVPAQGAAREEVIVDLRTGGAGQRPHG